MHDPLYLVGKSNEAPRRGKSIVKYELDKLRLQLHKTIELQIHKPYHSHR